MRNEGKEFTFIHVLVDILQFSFIEVPVLKLTIEHTVSIRERHLSIAFKLTTFEISYVSFTQPGCSSFAVGSELLNGSNVVPLVEESIFDGECGLVRIRLPPR